MSAMVSLLDQHRRNVLLELTGLRQSSSVTPKDATRVEQKMIELLADRARFHGQQIVQWKGLAIKFPDIEAQCTSVVMSETDNRATTVKSMKTMARILADEIAKEEKEAVQKQMRPPYSGPRMKRKQMTRAEINEMLAKRANAAFATE